MPKWLSKTLGYLFAGGIAFSLLAGLAGGIGVSIWGVLEISNGISSINWPTVEGTVVSTNLVQSYYQSWAWLADIAYAYDVNGKQFRGDRQRYDGGGSFCGDRDAASRYLAKYTTRGRMLVRYDPHHPARSVIEPGFRCQALFILAAGMVLLVGTSVMAVILLRLFFKLRKRR
ncbi:MAG: DUF3592 domain-containing protein [Verrucomicrobia bacterium]|nr:DUF3592 domain-containing protein [Verrucomicrobiota bacterium]